MHVIMANSKFRTLHRSLMLQTTITIIALSFCVFSVFQRNVQQKVQPGYVIKPQPLINDVPRNSDELIAKLADVTRKAENGMNKTEIFSSKKRLLWNKEHSCNSRHEIYALYSTRKSTHDIKTNPKWNSVLKEYSKLHRTCVQRMGNVTDFFLKRKHIDGCKFVVAGVSMGSGLGNKVLTIVSALVYAVLTQRVLLVPLTTTAPGVFCEPFEGSSWMVDPENNWTDCVRRRDLWDPLATFYDKVDTRDSSEALIKPTYAVSTVHTLDPQPESRFFCDTEQAQYTQVDWIHFRNNFYFVPKIFAVPSFRPLLEDIFPNRKILTHLLRTVMLPSDAVWGRVKQVHDAHFRHSNLLVGIQERYFMGKSGFDQLHTTMEENVVECLKSEGLLPTTNPKLQSQVFSSPRDFDKPSVSALKPLNVTTIFITSLYQSLFERLSQDYVRTALNSGDAVGLVQLTHAGTQNFGDEVDRQALTEIFCLSLTDHLVLTPLSTFGNVAQGYGGLVPWFIDLRPETPTPCLLAESAEVCYQLPSTRLFTCPHDADVNERFMTDVVPHLMDCNEAEKPFQRETKSNIGIQLATDWERAYPCKLQAWFPVLYYTLFVHWIDTDSQFIQRLLILKTITTQWSEVWSSKGRFSSSPRW